MNSPRWRPAVPVLAAVLSALIAGCGAAAQGGHQRAHRTQAVTVRGSLLHAGANHLTMQQGPGPGTVQVMFAPMTTPIYAVTSAGPGSIEPGSCLSVRGERDTTGTVTARAIVVAASVDDTCPAGSEPPPPPPADPSPSPPAASPSHSPSPLPGPALLAGQVLSLGGGAVAIEGAQGDPVVVLMPPGVQVLFFQPSGPSALVIPSCVVVEGIRSRRAIAARKIVDWPPGTEC